MKPSGDDGPVVPDDLFGDDDEEAPPSEVEEWAGQRIKRRRQKSASPTRIIGAQMAVERRIRERDDWASACADEIVALYAWCHRKVYGVDAEVLDGRTFLLAAFAAKRQLELDFSGDADAMVEHVRWVWNREADREKRRRQNPGPDAFRIGWRYMFKPGGGLLTDWAVARARGNGT